MVSETPNNNGLGESSDVLLGKLLQHYVDDMYTFQVTSRWLLRGCLA